MAIAGKVAITPKGEWNAQTAYTKLDLVFYDNASYVAIQPSAGVEPTNESYWMLMVQSAGGADLEGIINGDIQVGNAKTLDGHGAEYFFPKSGGEINGDISVAKQGTTLAKSYVKNGVHNGGLVTDSANFGLFDETLGKWLSYINAKGEIVHNGTASGNLPLTGGMIKNSSSAPFGITNTNGNEAYIPFVGSDGRLGYLGLFGKDNPVYKDSTNTIIYSLLHTGNKPTGTYTGNGDATSRTINTGGMGNALLIYASDYFCIVSRGGAIGKSADAEVWVRDSNECNFRDGVLTLTTTGSALNTDGWTYNYQVL